MTDFKPLRVAVLTVSDSRTIETDTSGQLLANEIVEAGHQLADRALVKDNIYQIRAAVSDWIAREGLHVVIVTGGTGFSGRDSTPEAVSPLFDKTVEGFGELFRQISVDQIGASTVQSRAVAGFANRTLIFCLPGSNNACQTAWDHIIRNQLDARTRPCNFAGVLLN